VELRDIKGCILTVCTVWCCELLRREERKGVLKRWFWMMILATAEIYGGMYSPFYRPAVHTGIVRHMWVPSDVSPAYPPVEGCF
jgi:hypothetical protein